MTRYPLYSYLLLIDPVRVQSNAQAASALGLVEEAPNTWQLCLAALRMWHRILFRSETIGTSSGPPPRTTWRAKLLAPRALRLPALVFERAIAPWDLTGLFSSPERITRHLLSAHHDKNQFVFDLQLLATREGYLEALVEETARVVSGEHPKAEWLRDLTVYRDYHENLLDAAIAAHRGDFRLSEGERSDPDLTLTGLLRWCSLAPSSPRRTWKAWRRGSFRLSAKQHREPAR